MSNPFAKTYEDLRRPYLEGKMAKKDYDGDGKIESGTDEYMGSRDKAIKKAMGKKVTKEHHQKDADGNVIPHEEDTEQLDELSTKTLGSYIKKSQSAGRSLRSKSEVAKRKQGIDRATDQKAEKEVLGRTVKKPKGTYDIKKYKGKKGDYLLGKEEVEHLDELSIKTLDSYRRKASKDLQRPDKKSYGKGNKFDRTKSMLKAADKISKKELHGEDVEQIDELSKKTLGGYVKKASKEARGNMVATQHGSGIPKKAKDIKLKQVNKRMKGIEKAGEKLAKEDITLTKGDYASRNVPTSAYAKAKLKNFKGYVAGGGLGSNFLPLQVNSHEPEGNPIEEKDTSAMKKYLDAKAKRLTKEREAQKPEYRNNPAFGDPSHHSNRKNRKEGFSDWRSEFIWEDGDSVKKI
jgi:hypothetical protein